jgi:hypothetical protein
VAGEAIMHTIPAGRAYARRASRLTHAHDNNRRAPFEEIAMLLKDTLHYELPPEGTTLLGYIVRRMHKTHWILPVRHLISSGDREQALASIAMYAIAACTSFGRAFYQPRFDNVGDEASEADPATGAIVAAKLESKDPHYRISYSARMPDGSIFYGSEEITGTTVGLRGLGMPAPSRFHFTCDEYEAELTGVITSELALSIFGNTRIRGHGFLNFRDNAGSSGKISVERNGSVKLEVNGKGMEPAEQAAMPRA